MAKMTYTNEIIVAGKIAIGHYNNNEKEFRSDLEVLNEIEGHPKAEILFNQAWELGHSYGYKEVKTHYEELLNLIK